MTQQSNENAALRHLIKTIQYRMDGALAEASNAFGVYSIGERTRSPGEILSHVSDVLSFAIDQLGVDSSFSFTATSEDWSGQVKRYRATLYALDAALANASLSVDVTERLIQGPVADVLTHVGQIAMLRGLAGSPVPGQNYFAANLPDLADVDG